MASMCQALLEHTQEYDKTYSSSAGLGETQMGEQVTRVGLT